MEKREKKKIKILLTEYSEYGMTIGAFTKLCLPNTNSQYKTTLILFLAQSLKEVPTRVASLVGTIIKDEEAVNLLVIYGLFVIHWHFVDT